MPSARTEAHQRGVKGELHLPKERKPFCHNLESATVKRWLCHTQIQVADHDVGRDPRTCFAAHFCFCRSHLHSETTPSKQTRP